MVKTKSLALALGALALAACADMETTAPIGEGPSFARSGAAESGYILLGSGGGLPASLEADVAAAGGTLTGTLAQVGVAFATSSSPGFANKAGRINGVQGVAEDVYYQWVDQTPRAPEVSLDALGDVEDMGHEVGGHETFRLMQWAPDAVSAPDAWASGARGAGARVAVLDGGINSSHIDIAPNLDAGRSRSFVPGQPYNFDTGTFWHGTHVAGIVAAPANALGTVGIAPEATIVGVKVLHNGSGSFSWILQGIVYAATPTSAGGAGAHIINMSLGGAFWMHGKGTAGLAHLQAAVNQVVTWARQQGVLVVAAAGNDAIDLDHPAQIDLDTRNPENLVFIPAQSANALAVSALGPMGWALGSMDLDRPASYTNFGQSAIDLAGPGGDFALPGEDPCTLPRLPSGTLTRPCWVFDMVMAPF
ncbi:MAG TPA: S8 family serine peptidase, partial [Gemmatimonadales bacterium]|nr:S8 family serine peptidase [Gemmatimonadales bacterium]